MQCSLILVYRHDKSLPPYYSMRVASTAFTVLYWRSSKTIAFIFRKELLGPRQGTKLYKRSRSFLIFHLELTGGNLVRLVRCKFPFRLSLHSCSYFRKSCSWTLAGLSSSQLVYAQAISQIVQRPFTANSPACSYFSFSIRGFGVARRNEPAFAHSSPFEW